MRLFLRSLAACAILSLCGAAMAEQIDNPEYAQWSKYKAGTFITLKQSTEMPGMAAMPNMPAGMDMAAMMPQTSMTTKLVEVKPDALTLETTTSVTQMGTTRDNKATRVIPAKIEKPTATAAATQGAAAEIKELKEGKDTVDVKGAKLETITREYTTTTTMSNLNGGTGRGAAGAGGADATPVTAHIKIWTSAEVPGGMVKNETTTTMEQMGDIKMTMTLIDYKVVK